MPALRLAADAFLRDAPAASGAPLAVAKRGTALEALGPVPTDGWWAVAWHGRAAWVSARLVKIGESTAAVKTDE